MCCLPEHTDIIRQHTPNKDGRIRRGTRKKERDGHERQQNCFLMHLERKQKERHRRRKEHVGQ